MKPINQEDLINDVLRVYFSEKRITRDLYLKKGKYSRKPIERIFGSWNNLLKHLDIPYNCLVNIPESNLLDELKRIYKEFGTISASVVKHHGKYCIETYQRRFGSFNAALEKASIEANRTRSTSPTADAMIHKLENILGEPAVKEKTFDWLVNPQTNKRFYIDAYFPRHNIAFEYNGPQHYSPVAKYGGEVAFKAIQERDAIKYSLIEKHNINLLVFHYLTPHTDNSLKEMLNDTLSVKFCA